MVAKRAPVCFRRDAAAAASAAEEPAPLGVDGDEQDAGLVVFHNKGP